MLKHLSLLGLRVNLEKSKLVPMQRISFLGMELDSVNQTARLTQERAQSVLNCFMTLSGRTAVPLKLFQRLLGHMAAAAVTVTLGLLHMRPLQHWLHGRNPRWAWTRGTHRVQITPACRKTFSPWSDPSFLRAGVPLEQVSRHAVVFTDASATGWVPPSEPTSTDTVQDQGGRGADLVIGSILPPCLVPGTHAPRDSPSLADSPEEGSAFSETGHPLAPASGPVETPRMVPGWDAEVLGDLPQEVALTIASARAPSTRRAYALKWNLFFKLCSSHQEDPRRCSIRAVLSFLQQGLERRLSPSALKVYVAAISTHHDPIEGKSVGKHNLVVRFLRGARRLNPPRPPSLPRWDLELVLIALLTAPFEPLHSVELKFLPRSRGWGTCRHFRSTICALSLGRLTPVQH